MFYFIYFLIEKTVAVILLISFASGYCMDMNIAYRKIKTNIKRKDSEVINGETAETDSISAETIEHLTNTTSEEDPLEIDMDDPVFHILEGNETTTENTTIVNQCRSGVFIPNGLNCSTFLACDHGRLTEANCPPNMWFDPNFHGDTLCNYPEVVCAANNSVCNCAVEYPPLEPDPLIEIGVQCLKDNRFHLSGSNVDCGRYFICYNENVFRMECRPGFHYNHQTEMCDYPELVNCKVI